MTESLSKVERLKFKVLKNDWNVQHLKMPEIYSSEKMTEIYSTKKTTETFCIEKWLKFSVRKTIFSQHN